MHAGLLFVLRWVVNAFGIWLTIRWFGTGYEGANFVSVAGVFLTAALILALLNFFIKPIISIISLPITIVTLGLFTLIINGLMVYIALKLTPDITITFGTAIIAGIIIGILNFAVNAIVGTADSE